MCSTVESWPLLPLVQLFAESLFAYCGQQGVGWSACEWRPAPIAFRTEVSQNAQVRKMWCWHGLHPFWGKGPKSWDSGQHDEEGQIHRITGAGLGISKLRKECGCPTGSHRWPFLSLEQRGKWCLSAPLFLEESSHDACLSWPGSGMSKSLSLLSAPWCFPNYWFNTVSTWAVFQLSLKGMDSAS